MIKDFEYVWTQGFLGLSQFSSRLQVVILVAAPPSGVRASERPAMREGSSDGGICVVPEGPPVLLL